MLAGASGSFLPGDAPPQDVLIRGLFAGEIGSLNEGPKLNDTRARLRVSRRLTALRPDSVRRRRGKKAGRADVWQLHLWGRFSSMFPGVETIHKRFAEEAVFLTVYVREAHPTDGWKMESNARTGVAVAQPKTFAERTAVATQCYQLLGADDASARG